MNKTDKIKMLLIELENVVQDKKYINLQMEHDVDVGKVEIDYSEPMKYYVEKYNSLMSELIDLKYDE